MIRFRHGILLCLASFQFLLGSAAAIDIQLDYTYDTSSFFGSGNPNGAAAGAQAKATLESVADFYSGILADTFSEVRTPDPFESSAFSGIATWSWTLNFRNPSSNSPITLADPTIASDEYRIYVGARSISGSTLGIGGPGGLGWSQGGNGGGFTSAEIGQINQITAGFSDAVEDRGETSGFANWGGAVTFDRDSSTNWHYDHTTSPSSGKSDFFSVAVHEIGHSLGLGASDNWDNWISGTNYTGPEAVNSFGEPVPLDCNINGCGHWANGTDSVVFGTLEGQEAAMDPTVTTGTRKRLTALDAAALQDIGWSVVAPVSYDPADFDTDGDVDGDDLATIQSSFGSSASGDTDNDGDTDGADFLAWQQQYTGPLTTLGNVPEPTSACLLMLGLAMLGRHRRLNRV